MKKLKVLALVLCVTVMSTGLSGCGILLNTLLNYAEKQEAAEAEKEEYDENYDYDYDYDYDTDYSDSYSDDDMDAAGYDEDYGDEDYGDEDYGYDEDAVAGDMMTVGSDAVGYIDLPTNYFSWTEADPGMPEGAVQYCDGTPYNIVTMVYYDMPGMKAYDFAQAMGAQFESDTAIAEDSLEMATVSLGGVEAYQIYGYYPADDQWLVIWLFDSPYDDYIHYVSAEFLSDNMDLFSMVENSYRFAE